MLHLTPFDKPVAYATNFDSIAKKILNGYTLQTSCNTYRIREIEFYYFAPQHPDYYCHAHERQLLNARFYFHRFKDPQKYSRLKHKGLDITLGNNEDSYGGILIRTIQNINTGSIINTIGKLVNQLLDDMGGPEEIERLYKTNKDVFDTEANLRLVPVAQEQFKVFKKQRQNLNLKKQDIDKFYIKAPYNYFTYPIVTEV